MSGTLHFVVIYPMDCKIDFLYFEVPIFKPTMSSCAFNRESICDKNPETSF